MRKEPERDQFIKCDVSRGRRHKQLLVSLGGVSICTTLLVPRTYLDIAVVIMGMDMFGSRVTKVLKFLAALKGIYMVAEH